MHGQQINNEGKRRAGGIPASWIDMRIESHWELIQGPVPIMMLRLRRRPREINKRPTLEEGYTRLIFQDLGIYPSAFIVQLGNQKPMCSPSVTRIRWSNRVSPSAKCSPVSFVSNAPVFFFASAS